MGDTPEFHTETTRPQAPFPPLGRQGPVLHGSGPQLLPAEVTQQQSGTVISWRLDLYGSATFVAGQGERGQRYQACNWKTKAELSFPTPAS